MFVLMSNLTSPVAVLMSSELNDTAASQLSNFSLWTAFSTLSAPTLSTPTVSPKTERVRLANKQRELCNPSKHYHGM